MTSVESLLEGKRIVICGGPGGVGKTTLLGEFAAACAARGIPAWRIDGRNIDSVPDAFIGALGMAMGLTPPASPLDALAGYPGRQVILVDTYETLNPLDGWLREQFLPQLPADVLVVLAGRQPPALAWRIDPGWQSLVQTVPLRNLMPQESRVYLAERQVPPEQHNSVLEFTHGHPLALSLVADLFAQRREWRFQPEAAPDVVKMLLEQFVQKVPGPAHRAALETCALVRLTTEALLAEALLTPDAHELFEWLRGLSFVESGPDGLYPHDLARDALDADLHWRDPEAYQLVFRGIRAHILRRLKATRGRQQQRSQTARTETTSASWPGWSPNRWRRPQPRSRPPTPHSAGYPGCTSSACGTAPSPLRRNGGCPALCRAATSSPWTPGTCPSTPLQPPWQTD
jgi:hypothetical protein